MFFIIVKAEVKRLPNWNHWRWHKKVANNVYRLRLIRIKNKKLCSKLRALLVSLPVSFLPVYSLHIRRQFFAFVFDKNHTKDTLNCVQFQNFVYEKLLFVFYFTSRLLPWASFAAVTSTKIHKIRHSRDLHQSKKGLDDLRRWHLNWIMRLCKRRGGEFRFLIIFQVKL